jgi:hypothetical protein
MNKLFAVAAVSLFALSAQAADVIGTSGATFTHAANLDSGAVFSGVNTSSFTWGNGSVANVGPNNLTFTGANFSANFGQDFKLGTLSYFNGTTALNSNLKNIDLRSNLNFVQPGIPSVASDFTLRLNSTTNTSDPIASADFVNFSSTNSSSRFVIGGATYTVRISGFRNIVGDGFLQSSATEFHVLEGRRASADLYGSVVVASAPVPEPETYALMLAGLAMLGVVARRRKQA